MKREEALFVLQTIQEVYPKYDLPEMKVRMLVRELLPMDYVEVMKNLARHTARYPYPPMIAEIAAYPREREEQVERLNQWRKEAEEVPEEMREAFHKQMLKVLEEKSKGIDQEQ